MCVCVLPIIFSCFVSLFFENQALWAGFKILGKISMTWLSHTLGLGVASTKLILSQKIGLMKDRYDAMGILLCERERFFFKY